MTMKSWLHIAPGSGFSLANIPFGIISTSSSDAPQPAIAVGEYALNLAIFSLNEGFSALSSIQPHLSVFEQPTLNAFATLGRRVHGEVRRYLQDVFSEMTKYPHILRDNESNQHKCLFLLKDIELHLPMHIGDYSDFYGGMNHAVNAGTLFRGPDNALQPNFTHFPGAYHGRASSVVVSGTPIRRPCGQILEDPNSAVKVPIFTQCRMMDFELELGAFVCRANNMGERIPISEADDSLFGYVLMNDWSARDIQRWEYVPLGPFNGKNLGTAISAWVVLADAMEPFRKKGIENKTELKEYLREKRVENVFDLHLEVDITSISTSCEFCRLS